MKNLKSNTKYGEFDRDNPFPAIRVSGNGLILSVNKPGRKLLLTNDSKRLITEIIIKHFDEDQAGGKKQGYFEFICAGRTYSFSIVPGPLRNTFNLYGVDITEKKNSEQELDRLKKQALSMERFSIMGQMSSGIVHDINNALVPIMGFSELILLNPEKLSIPEKTKKNVNEIYQAAKSASNVIARLKSFYRTRKETDYLKAIDLRSVVEQTLMFTSPKWKVEMEGCGIRIKIETRLEGLPVVIGEESELREMIVNLIFNAIDAMPEGGTLGFYGSLCGEEVCLKIKDTGTGMSEEVRKNCFKPFFSTKGEKGSGLGLALAQSTIKKMRGRIEVESQQGKGSIFSIYLPAGKPTRPSRAEKNPERSRTPKKILLVDDNSLVRDVVKQYLMLDGHDVEAAKSGIEALEMLSRSDFDVVFTDMAMPGMAGTELASIIKAKCPETAVILLTGFGKLMIYRGEKVKNIDYILSKPISAEKIRAALNRVAERAGAGKREYQEQKAS